MCGARGNDSPYTGIITSMSDILHQLHYQDTKFLDLWCVIEDRAGTT